MFSRTDCNKIWTSTLAANFPLFQREGVVAALAQLPEVLLIAQTLGTPKLIRELRLIRDVKVYELPKLEQAGDQVLYQKQSIGKIQVLYKSPIPGELQARLTIESAIERFLEYLQNIHQIVVLDESDRPDDRAPPYTIAFGQSALMLETLTWSWKPKEDEGWIC